MFTAISQYLFRMLISHLRQYFPIFVHITAIFIFFISVAEASSAEGGYTAEFIHQRGSVAKKSPEPAGIIEALGTMIRLQSWEGSRQRITIFRPDDGMTIQFDDTKKIYNQLPYTPGSVWFTQFEAMRHILQKNGSETVAGVECDRYTAPMNIAQFCYSEKYRIPLRSMVGEELYEISNIKEIPLDDNRFLPPKGYSLGFSFPGLKKDIAKSSTEGDGNHGTPAKKDETQFVFLPELSEDELKKAAFPLRIHTLPVNGGFTRNLEEPVQVSFSQPLHPDLLSFSIEQKSEGWLTVWRDDYREVTLAHKSPLVPGRIYNLSLNVIGYPEHTITFTAKDRSPTQRLRHDLNSSQITVNQAAVYQIEQLINPTKIPARYRLKKMPASGTPALRKILKEFPKLDEETQTRLWPYFLSSKNPDSYWYKLLHKKSGNRTTHSFSLVSNAYAEEELAIASHITSSGYNIVVIGPPDWEEMVNLANEIIIEEDMFEDFHKLMGKTPPHPGDRKLLIHIVGSIQDISGDEDEPYGWCPLFYDTMEYSPTSHGIPEIFISGMQNLEVYDDEQKRRLGSTLAHEMFHAFQDRFNRFYQNWATEGTAVWAEDHIKKAWNTEQGWANDAFWSSLSSLKDLENSDFDYSMFLFPLYLTRNRPQGNNLIRQIYENMGPGDDEDADTKAVKTIFGSDFKNIWKEYALAVMDVAPEDGKFPDSYLKWGEAPLKLKDRHGFDESEISEIGAGGFAVQLDKLSASFHLVKNENKGSDAPAVRFDISQFRQDESVSVQAIVVYRDKRRVYEDWSDMDKRVFCLSNPQDNFKEIYIVIACSSEKEEDRLFTLDIYPDEEVDCQTGAATITLNSFGNRDWDITKRYGAATDKGSNNYSYRTSVRLALEPWREDIPPQLQGMLKQMPALYPEVDKTHMDMGKKEVEAAVKKPATYDDPNTGLKVLKYRVTSIQLLSDGGRKSGSSATTSKDSMGPVIDCHTEFSENVQQRGLDDSAQEGLKERRIKVEIFVHPESGEIKWVRLPMVGIEREIISNSKTNCNKRYQNKAGNYYYKNEKNSYNDIKESKIQLTHDSPKEQRKEHPMDPVWKSEGSSRTNASGQGRIKRPLNKQYNNPDYNGYIREKNTIEFKWRLSLKTAQN